MEEQYKRNWKNYYEILQVSPSAEHLVITAAYKRLAQRYHPDTVKARIEQLKAKINYYRHNPEASDAEYGKLVRELEELQNSTTSTKMADINEAYEILSDPFRRAAYDRVFRTKYPSQEAETDEPTEEEIIIGLMRLAAEKSAEGKNRSQVADELTKEGVPYDVAVNIVQRVFEYRSELRRKEGGKSIGCGLLMLVVGGIITGVSYLVASEGALPENFMTRLAVGIIVFGGISLLIGIFRWLTS